MDGADARAGDAASQACRLTGSGQLPGVDEEHAGATAEWYTPPHVFEKLGLVRPGPSRSARWRRAGASRSALLVHRPGALAAVGGPRVAQPAVRSARRRLAGEAGSSRRRDRPRVCPHRHEVVLTGPCRPPSSSCSGSTGCTSSARTGFGTSSCRLDVPGLRADVRRGAPRERPRHADEAGIEARPGEDVP